jgi:hypothetical protein
MKSAVFVFLNGLVSIPRTSAVVLVSTPRHIPIAKVCLFPRGDQRVSCHNGTSTHTVCLLIILRLFSEEE